MDPAMGWISQILTGLAKPFQWWVVIAPWEAGILVRLGKHAKTLGPGIHFRIPWLDRIYIQSTRTRILCEQGQTMTTADGKVLTLAVNVQWRMSDIAQMFQSISDPEAVVLGKVAGLVAELVSRTNSADLSPKKIEDYSGDRLSAAEWGLDGIKIMITNFAYVKTYRLLSNEYRSYSMGSIDNQKPV